LGFSFSQDREEDLLKLISVYWDNPDWQKCIKEKIFFDFYPALKDKLEKIKQIWKKNKNIDDFIIKSLDYLKLIK